jgi:hypothetical protein
LSIFWYSRSEIRNTTSTEQKKRNIIKKLCSSIKTKIAEKHLNSSSHQKEKKRKRKEKQIFCAGIFFFCTKEKKKEIKNM